MSSERFRYEIDENNAVSIWDNDNLNEDNSPNLYQPHPPTEPLRPFTREEAQSWVDEEIFIRLNPPENPPKIEPFVPKEEVE